MSALNKLRESINRKKSFLCVGLDTDINKIPKYFLKYNDPVLAYNQVIIEQTLPFAVSYKINTAFYESRGLAGWQTMEETLKLIPNDVFTIADAKRGDIGNTAKMYADAFFKQLNFDSLTLAPYMGVDTLEPYLKYEDKVLICLALTSNPGSNDFELQKLANGKFLYQEVLQTVSDKIPSNNLMFVVGATHPEKLKEVRKYAPNNFFLVPGVGAQGGTVKDVAENALTDDIGLLINVSRGIIFANGINTTANDIAAAAKSYQISMLPYFENK